MSQRHTLRLGGATAFAGGVLTFVGNILHPREPGQLDSAANLFDVVVRNHMWAADHVAITIGLALLLHGFYGVTQSIRNDPGAAWAHFAWHMAVIGVLLGLALMLTEAVAVTSLAHAWKGSLGGEKDLLLAAGNAVFELSLTFSVGGMLFLFGAAPVHAPYSVLFPIASIAVTLWITYLGYRMWRIAVNATA